jgi:hypothetical protein
MRDFGVNNNTPNLFRTSISSIQPWLTILLLCLLLGSISLGWLVKSALILIGCLILLPVLIAIGFFWWLRLNLVSSPCPVCSYEPLQSIKGQTIQCPNCSEELIAQSGVFIRSTPPGTIDIIAVEVDPR